jgi:hypothetical protein
MPYAFAHGSGTEGDPYQIWSIEDFMGFMADLEEYLGLHYKLMVDLDFSDREPFHGRGDYNPTFNGVFDFAGRGLSNLSVTAQRSRESLFGNLHGAMLNLRIDGLTCTAEPGVTEYGALFTYASGTLTTAYLRADVLPSENKTWGIAQDISSYDNETVLSGIFEMTGFTYAIAEYCQAPMQNAVIHAPGCDYVCDYLSDMDTVRITGAAKLANDIFSSSSPDVINKNVYMDGIWASSSYAQTVLSAAAEGMQSLYGSMDRCAINVDRCYGGTMARSYFTRPIEGSYGPLVEECFFNCGDVEAAAVLENYSPQHTNCLAIAKSCSVAGYVAGGYSNYANCLAIAPAPRGFAGEGDE